MKAKKSRSDFILNVLCLAVLLGTAAWLLTAWGAIPEEVPTHYTVSGTPDRFGPKEGLIPLALVPWGVYILLTALRFLPPSMWNTGFAVTEEEKARSRANTVRLLDLAKLIVAALFSGCVLASAAGLPMPGWLAVPVIAATFGVAILWFRRENRLGR